ncbi:uncharacterized protein LOC132755826 isoform X2 [Ruditapes philippinarum]|uniref:uncharacterized protein LOC132755826 isoform X2 n=1 Tax=Ruditapes philippinarum TaxID=129788 RepID=UPI00295B80E7|nr:uncharacterized protein LOC132755826 isoform X2 [Ruditapes philippinarum]
MDLNQMKRFLVWASICGLLKTACGVTVKYSCLPSQVTGSEFKFTVRVRKDGDNTITGIAAVDSKVNPNPGNTPAASGCTTTTEESTGIYALSADIDTDSLSCGVSLDSGTTYNIQIRATGTNSYFTFQCDTTDLLPSSVSVTNFATTGVTGVLHHVENPFGIKAQVLDADGNYAPVRSVKLGQDIKLRLIYDTGHLETGPTNLGMVFHTGYIRHTGSELYLKLFTPGLGTNVHITGVLSGKTIDEWVVVKRDSPVKVSIPSEYQNTVATKSSWTKEVRGLKIESRDCKIGVILGAEKGTDTSAMTVLPDDILGDSYRPFASTETAVNGDQEVLLVATVASTEVEIKYNDFTKPGGFQIDNANVGNVAATKVTLDENELLHILCDAECDDLQITSTENIAVVSGWDNQGHASRASVVGDSSAQVIPNKYYSNKYVTLQFPLFEFGYIILSDDPTDTITYADSSTPSTPVSQATFYRKFHTSEVSFDKPVSVYMHVSDGSSGTPALLQYPSVEQWATSYFLTIEDGVTYYAYIVTQKGEYSSITMNGRSLMQSFGDATDVPKLLSTAAPGRPAYYEVKELNFDKNTFDGKLNVHFESGDRSKPFMLFMLKRGTDNSLTAFLPFGVRYPTTNPCVPSTSVPGDNLDNDCDGKVDEEMLNNVDDDGDSRIDEDVALNPLTAGSRGIYVKTLLIADNAGFTCSTTVHSSGCNIITPDTKLMGAISPFKRNTNLASEFSDYWVIDTDPFNAFKYLNKDKVYFRIEYDFCVGNLALCEKSCATRRKRSASAEDKFLDLMLQVNGNDTEVHVIGPDNSDVIGKGKQAGKHPCTDNALLWVPVTLLLLMTLFYATMTVFFLYYRYKIMNNL